MKRQLLRPAVAELLVTTAAVAVACSDDRAGELEISEVYGDPDSTFLELGIESCNRDPSVVVTESEHEVRVRAEADLPPTSDDCLDGAIVTLDAMLGDRAVIDDRTGDELEVLPLEEEQIPDN